MMFRNPTYVLPSGDVWHGLVHQDPDGNWMTGSSYTSTSLPLSIVDEVWTFPATGHVASQKVLEQVFSYIEKDSVLSEDTVKTFNSKVVEIKETLDLSERLIDASLEKVETYLASKNIRSESYGRGSIHTAELNLTLTPTASVNKTEYIQEMVYLHSTDEKHFLWQGNIEAGVLYNQSTSQDELTQLTLQGYYLEMISRNSTDIGFIQEEDCLLDTEYEDGFNGTVSIKLSSATLISYISFPNNIGLSTAVINKGTDTEKECPLNTEFAPISASTISIELIYSEPVTFQSYFSDNLSEDFLGEGVVDGRSKEIYQRTRVRLGPVGISLKSYEKETISETDTFSVSSGALSNIFFTADEYLHDDIPSDESFQYHLVIQNTEYPINPYNRAGEDPQSYIINSPLSSEARAAQENSAFIDTDYPVGTWKLKVTLSRKTEEQATPILKNVKFTYITTMAGGLNV